MSTARAFLPECDRVVMLSSSPSLPDVRDLVAKKQQESAIFRVGSAASPRPSNLVDAHTSAAKTLRIARTNDNSFDTIDASDLSVVKKPAARRGRRPTNANGSKKETETPKASPEINKKTKMTKRVGKEVIILSSDGGTPKLLQRYASASESSEQTDNALGFFQVASNDETSVESQSWKNRKPPLGQGQTEFREGKSGPAISASKCRRLKKSSESVTSRFQAQACMDPNKSAAFDKATSKEKRPRTSTPEPINLEIAVQRRTDWTPPPQDTIQSKLEPLHISTDIATPAYVSRDTDVLEIFKSLHDTFGHKLKESEAPLVTEQQTAKVFGKRKVIEMVAVNQTSIKVDIPASLSPAKKKVVKRKPRTITEMAVAAYAQLDTSEVDESARREDSSLLGFFSSGVANQIISTEKPTVAKGKGTKSKISKGKKKMQPRKPILLSPQAAMNKSAAQDFVFGTSSQLAREQSPALIRNLHETSKASTIREEDERSIRLHGDHRLAARKSAKGLWSVSARDGEGDFVNVDVIDLLDSPVAFPKDDATLDPCQVLAPPEPEAAVDAIAASSSLIRPPAISNNHKFSEFSRQNSGIPAIQRKITINSAAAASPERSDSSFPSINHLVEYEMPPPSNQQQDQEEVRASPNKAIVENAPESRPKYELFTDAKLAKEISKYGFKPVKSRGGMISLLDQCWKSKILSVPTGGRPYSSSIRTNPRRSKSGSPGAASTTASSTRILTRIANKSVAAGTGDEVASEDAPTKKRGRKSQNEAVQAMPSPSRSKSGPSTLKRRKTAAETKSNSESNLDSEVEHSSPEQLFSMQTGDLSITDDTEVSLGLDTTVQQSAIFTHITNAVTSAPRTTDAKKPSWHEKMLMYDPIIIEDLTLWLNSGQLTRVGFDDEVSPVEVKKWCESRSICCLWEKSVRGKERKRF